MTDLLKAAGGPGSWGFFAAVTLVGASLMLARRTRPTGRLVVGGLVLSYFVLSVPIVANRLADGLGPYEPLSAASYANQRLTLAVLGGDNSVARDGEARRLVAALAPAQVLVLGDPGITRTMDVLGVRRFDDGGAATTTREQIALVAGRCRSAEPVVVIASRLQMRRVGALARAARLEIIPAVSDLDTTPPKAGVRRWIPSAAALRVSRDAIYEYAALAYYRWRGWI